MVLNAQKNLCVITVINNYVNTRKFGIGTQALFPPLKDLQVVKTEPPIYRLNVDGERIELKAEELQEQRLFIRACMNQIYTKPPKIKPKDFDEMINLLMTNKEEVEAPAGSSMIEQLKQHVENYCLGRATSGATREDLEAGNVWNNKGYHHFVFSNFFYQFLARHKWAEKPQFTLYVLREHCGYDTDYRVSLPKKKISVIRLPEFEKEGFKPKDRVFKQEDAFLKTIVLGPPGTGKTTTLLNEVDKYLKQTDPDKIGYFSFTQKAAYEARDRAMSKFNFSEKIYHILEHYTH